MRFSLNVFQDHNARLFEAIFATWNLGELVGAHSDNMRRVAQLFKVERSDQFGSVSAFIWEPITPEAELWIRMNLPVAAELLED